MSDSSKSKVRERLKLRERRYDTERRMRVKRSEQLKVLEEVFDKPTLTTIYSLLNRGYLQDIFGVVSSGKESRVYWGKDSRGAELAIKIYLTTSADFKRGMQKYLQGDPRFERVSRDTRSLIYLWARKEYDNLRLARDAGVRVPRAVAVEKNVLLMEFIGSKGVSAPLLRESPLEDPVQTFKEIIKSVANLYQKAQLVHGDLSEYNIMFSQNHPVIFDFSQAVKLDHPMAETFLRRDLTTISKYFSGVADIPSLDALYGQVTVESAE